jgi:predicted HicB family RNase H-like nuclease
MTTSRPTAPTPTHGTGPSMPNAPKTPSRNVRVPDDLWHAAMSKALDRGESLSDVIRRALEKYVKG